MSIKRSKQIMADFEDILLYMSFIAVKENRLDPAAKDIIETSINFWNELATRILGYDLVFDNDIEVMLKKPEAIPEMLGRFKTKFEQEVRYAI